ncbi:MAG TPA: hypothetical protein VET66_10870 [Steroidobacteraceae bacterium]|nr:hypothetical protein [Steroidobacteraceae bacterium]
MPDVAVLLSIGRHPASGRPRRADRDARALQLALAERDDPRIAARVHAIHAGEVDAAAEEALRDYLGQGIDRVTVLTGAGPDVEAALVEHLRRLKPAVILTGAVAERGDCSGMLPYRLAEALGAQIVANAVSFSLHGDTARVVQALPRGARQALRMRPPFVLTVDGAAPEPRMSAFGPARRGSIQAVPALRPALPAPAQTVEWAERPARPRPRRLRTMGPASAAERLRRISAVGSGATSGQRLQSLEPQQAAQAIWQYLLDQGLLAAGAPEAGPDPGARGPDSGQ